MSDKIQVMHVGVGDKAALLSMPEKFSIRADDTIMDIKRKIALVDKTITVDEIYLYGKIKKKEDPENIFTLFTEKTLRSAPSIPYSDIRILEKNYGNINCKNSKDIRK